jgi:hypothetical protein
MKYQPPRMAAIEAISKVMVEPLPRCIRTQASYSFERKTAKIHLAEFKWFNGTRWNEKMKN